MAMTAREMFRNRPKPVLHFAADCWINDPCAPGYDVHHGLYHLFFQSKAGGVP